MELRYKFVLYGSIAFAVLFLVLYLVLKRKNKKYAGGEKIYGMALLKDNSYLKRKKIIYRVMSFLAFVALLTGIISAGFLIARPYEEETRKEDQYSRDIMLCLDVSTSVDYLNQKLIDELIEVVKSLKGERFGIVMFNTSPVLVSPLTDDYEFIIEQLENISTSLEVRLKYYQYGVIDDDFFYWDQFISGGTLVGNEDRGSSLVGDGLASTVYHFSDLDKDRTRIAILTTDNDVYGEEIFDLPDACQLCKDNKITVYGVGTKEMLPYDMTEMQTSVELTGGSFYLEENAGSFDDIVSDIERQSKNKIKGKTYTIETEYPTVPFIMLMISTFIMIAAIRVLKK